MLSRRPHPPARHARSARAAAVRAAAALAIAAATLAGCSAPSSPARGDGSSSSAPATSSSSTSAPSRLLAPDAFAAEVSGGDRVVVNVHTPDEGSIDGTDASIPFDQVADRAGELPADRDAPLAVYCRSGSMSAEASVTLARLGYTDVVELDGGMKAWAAAGRPLVGA